METRRTMLSRTIALASAGGVLRAGPAERGPEGESTNRLGPPYAQTAAESASGVFPKLPLYPPGDVRRYGLIPNSPAAENENTRALKALVSPEGSFRGSVWFPNTSGSDV